MLFISLLDHMHLSARSCVFLMKLCLTMSENSANMLQTLPTLAFYQHLERHMPHLYSPKTYYLL